MYTEKKEIQLDGMEREERRGKMGMGEGIWERKEGGY